METLGIEDDELIDGYEFIGGYWGFQEYLDNSIDKLLKVLGDEDYDDEFEIDEFWYDGPDNNDSNDEDGKKGNNSKEGKKKLQKKSLKQEYSINYYHSSPITKSYTLTSFDIFKINGISVNTPFTVKISSVDPTIIFELRN